MAEAASRLMKCLLTRCSFNSSSDPGHKCDALGGLPGPSNINTGLGFRHHEECSSRVNPLCPELNLAKFGGELLDSDLAWER